VWKKKESIYERIGTVIDPNFGFFTLFGGDLSCEQKVDDTNFAGRVIGHYSITENVNTYLTWSRGYKGAGIDVAESVNAAVIAESGGLPVVDPEIPTLVELGFKGWFLNNSLSVNTALFHQSVEGLQATVIGAAGQAVENLSIGEIVSDGIEMDITYLPPVDGLTFTGSVTWLDVKYEKYDQRPDLEGEDYQDIPELAVSFIGDYSFVLGDGGWNSFVRAEYYWQDDKNTRSSGEEIFDVDAYGLLNLRAGVTSPSDTYSVTFAVENATDEDYPYFIGGSSYSSLGSTSTSQYLGPDRIVRLTLGATF
jgi:iron complex outermembrane receptor protein